jgi:hypothetical protein
LYLPGRRANAGHCLRLHTVTGKVHPFPADPQVLSIAPDAVADSPEDYWSASSLGEQLGAGKLTGWGARSWRQHISTMITAKKLGAWKAGNAYRLRLPGAVSSLSAGDLAAMGAGPASDDEDDE